MIKRKWEKFCDKIWDKHGIDIDTPFFWLHLFAVILAFVGFVLALFNS